MGSRRISSLFLFMIIAQSVGENMRSVRMSSMRGWKFQCATSTCLPFVNVITSTIIKCQMVCLAQTYCRAASFHQSTSNCELFTDMSNEITNMLTDMDIITMIVISGTRSPPEPTTTTSTTTSSTTSSTTTTTSSSTTTSTTTSSSSSTTTTTTTTTTTSSSTTTTTTSTSSSTTTTTTSTSSSSSTTTTTTTATTTTTVTTVCPLSSQSSWSQTATTIFGSQAGTSGSNLSLLNDPIGMDHDESNNVLIVSDNGNNRILRISLNNSPSVATVIAGGNGGGCNMNQLTTSVGVAFDSSRRVHVTDADCNRIVRFPSSSNSTTNATLLGNISSPLLVFINALNGDIYVVGYTNNSIYKFVGGSGSPVVAAGGNGNGNALNQLSGPVGVYYDYLYTNSLYVADSGNQRIMKFPSGSTSATYGTVVAGGNSVGSGANQLNNPRTVLVDSSGILYIADGYNNRIQRWLQNATSGTTIVGGTQGTASNQLNWPETILFDRYGNLIVVDRNNNRIQRFNITTC